MKPDRYPGLRCNEVGYDKTTDKYVVVTNCKCALPHETTEAYNAAHADGCEMHPFEGLVVTAHPDGTVVTWTMQDVTGWSLFAVSPEVAASVKDQIQAILEVQRKAEKAMNFRRRKVR